MDNLTHTLAGLALAEAGLKRTTRLATAILVLGANLPDVDGVIYLFGGSTDGLAFRRGWTHGVLAMALLPPLLVALVLGWDRLRGRSPGLRAGWLLALAAIGIWSHPLLDLLNTYGVRLLMPFSGRWFYGDALFIVDPWLWLTLLLGITLSRRRARAVARPPARSGRPAQVALSVAVVYALAMALASSYAANSVKRLDGEEESASRVLAAPVFGNSFQRDIVREFGHGYEEGSLRLVPLDYTILRRRSVGLSPAATAAARTRAGAAFLAWARFPVFRYETAGDSLDVIISDARYEGRGNRSWASVRVRVPLVQRKEGM